MGSDAWLQMIASDCFSPFTPLLPTSSGRRRKWARLYGGAQALAIAQAARRHGGPLLALTSNSLKAEALGDELRFYLGDEKRLSVLHFPDWETLPYDHFSPFQDIVSERLATLARLPSLAQGVLVVPISTLMHRLVPRSYIEAHSLLVKVGDTLDRERYRTRLEHCGYRCVSQVMEHGDFAVRGSLIDIFPMGSLVAYRIDLFDEDVDSIRQFDIETQRSASTVSEIHMLPAREVPLTEEAIGLFRSQWRTRFSGNPVHSLIYQDISQGIAPSGVEYYLPLFFEGTATLFDYLPASTLVVVDEGVEEAADGFWKEICSRYEQGRYDVERPLLEPADLFLQVNEVFSAIKQHAAVSILGLASPEREEADVFATSMPLAFPIDARAPDPLGVVKRFLGSFQGRVLFAAESKGRRETLSELLRQHCIEFTAYDDWQAFLEAQAPVGLTVAPLQQGLQLESPRVAVISESQLFGERVTQRRRRARTSQDVENIVRNLTELHIGAPVVHEQHGVGRYLGLFTLEAGGVLGEFLGLEYADQDRLYVPVASLHLISRYSGVDPEHAPLHKLGSGQWQRARARAAERVRDVAAELLDMYARRAARQGYAFPVEQHSYSSFAQGFPFEETPDQEAAIMTVLEDMRAGQPMDRLVCGDVGFGKTEVAMRAAFVATMGGRQVAILVPTTLLAQQHFQNFQDRFADWPVRIEELSRFRGKKEQVGVIAGLAEGSVDIVIGTHKLLQETIKFKRLGLLIIDEEHRFGVRQKERIKALRSEVDILTLTATPIPRTLNLALCGTRELSVIATPPARRLSVKTFVNEWNDSLLREALLREISRGGQVYFLHNDVESMEPIAHKVAALIPEARVRIAHGQMRERELEQAMLDFYHRRFNVLVCTTIIETGIDVPSANTIIINRADKFGLAQLYQLRGRVGRSHHQAYAYLLIPSKKALTAEAVKRLEAIEALEDLGVGFTLATHDLEIRGAGEILGEEQSGHIQEIGYGLYMELLERAVAALKTGRQPQLEQPLDHGAEIDLHMTALIPEDYLPDVHTRLILYKRIAGAADFDELNCLAEEMVDRFGLLPRQTKNLFKITEIKLQAARLGIRKVELGPQGGRIRFRPEPNVDPRAILKLVQQHPQTYRFEKGESLRITTELTDDEARTNWLRDLFSQLGA